MTTIKSLEERVADLEKQVYGLGKAPKVNDVALESSVIDSLSHVNTLISSALSGREKANNAIKRLPELYNYLDPMLEGTDIPTEAKLQLLIAVHKDIDQNYALLLEMQKLMPVLETEHLLNVPELTNKLNELNFFYLNLYEKSEGLNSEINEMFSKYNELINSISMALLNLDAAVTAAEIAAKPKKQWD